MTVTVNPTNHGAWHDGLSAGRRQFVDIGALDCERGGHLPAVRMAYETWGTLNAARDNVILIEHALTGDSHVAGPIQDGHLSPGWWDGIIGPGQDIDTDLFYVVAINVLGGCQGSTGPASADPDGRPWGSRFPFLTIRDQVAAEAATLDALGIDRLAAVIGGSMGGMRALEWAVSEPDRVERLVLLASCAYATADQIAWCLPQLLAIRQDPYFAGGDYYDQPIGPDQGLGLARRIAHATYRSGQELTERFGRDAQPGEEPLGGRGRYAIESYLDHHADKLIRRFDANSYLVLTEAMNSHDVGRGRGGLAPALAQVHATATIIAVDSDRLYPTALSAEVAAALPESTPLHEIHSAHGHDGFLIEIETVGALIRSALHEV